MNDDTSVYDYPQYFDLLFRDETRAEADFIEGATARYGSGTCRRLFEPGCGGGRLVVEMARRGYDVTGLDQSEIALRYLRRRLARRQLTATLVTGDLARFSVPGRFDAAFCTFNTFRHLLSEQAAREHLHNMARTVRRGGIYILGFHLLPLDVDEACIERWTARHGSTRVCLTLRVLRTSRRRRLEWLRLSMLAQTPRRTTRVRTEFPLRMYTARQWQALLRAAPEWELCDVFDFWYDLNEPLTLDDHLTDSVFVLRRR